MHVAVLGGGLQGCCVALELAARGIRVTVFDRESGLLTRTAIANEGKIHLGYMYASDPSLRTARLMAQGALAFAPFFARHLGVSPETFRTSSPTTYTVHRDSQRSVEEVAIYLRNCHAIVVESAGGKERSYFGMDLGEPPRRLSGSEGVNGLNPYLCLAEFRTSELAIDPHWLASAVRTRIADVSLIDLRLDTEVLEVRDEVRGARVASRTDEVESVERFDHVVNALWDGRLAIDAKRGQLPSVDWLFRLKYGVRFRPSAGAALPPSVTIVSGPFGEIVTYADGRIYLTWYPHCMRALARDIAPPSWPKRADPDERTAIIEGTLTSLSEIAPQLRDCAPSDRSSFDVVGGVIVASATTDIVDPNSWLHHRYDIGVSSHGSYHSVDPGKLTMAPYFAEMCASRICG
jgi:glycine/D-amino acid oxidase-like deaminating enzyme